MCGRLSFVLLIKAEQEYALSFIDLFLFMSLTFINDRISLCKSNTSCSNLAYVFTKNASINWNFKHKFLSLIAKKQHRGFVNQPCLNLLFHLANSQK